MHFSRLLAASAVPFLAAAAPEPRLYSRATTITVDTTKTYQTIDGFGFSEAFQRANNIVNLPAPKQKDLLDLLFNTTTGAGFSILRIGIGSSVTSDKDFMNTIEPKNPGGPTATPTYVWDGKDSGQVFVAQQAVSYGVRTFYGNAWSPPGFMKTNNNENNGGYLCGVSGEKCTSGDWRQAFANYLIAWSQFYATVGVNITHLGFLNEPENA
jgi:O-glycosyl hydrolase